MSNSSPYKVAILAVGNELLNGQVLDTNSAWLGEILNSHDLPLQCSLSCNDIEAEIQQNLTFLLKNHQAVIVSGGLGPTSDDLTREAISKLLNLKLELNQKELTRIKGIFASRKREFVETNVKQALIPSGAEVIDNPIGTAPGFHIKLKGQAAASSIFALPGVPREMKLMFRYGVLPILRKESARRYTSADALLRLFGLPESQVAELIEDCGLSKEIVVSYRATIPEIRVGFKADLGEQKKSAELIADAVNRARSAIGSDYIFSESHDQGIEQVIHRLLSDRNKTISVAESCSAGMLGAALTEIGGASKFFLGGVQAYSNELKIDCLKVDRGLLAESGAVSSEIAKLMAKGVKELSASDYALSITGIAGPEGGTAEKPVGTFFVGLAGPNRQTAFKYFYPSTRDGVRKFAVFVALDLLRRELLGLPLRAAAIP